MKYDEEIDVRRLRLNPGDVVILTVPLGVGLTETDAAFKAFKGKLSAAGHGDTPVILSTGEVSVSVLDRNAVQGSEGPVPVQRLGDGFAASILAKDNRIETPDALNAVVGWRMRTAHNPNGWNLLKNKPEKGDRFGRDGWFVEPLGVLPFRLPTLAPSPDLRTFAARDPLPADVAELVYAARAVAFSDWNTKVSEQSEQADMIKRLDRASEAFAELLPWEDDPNDETPDEPPARPAQRVAGELVAERMRQITGENYKRAHDDGYQPHELPAAAAAYAFAAATRERYLSLDPVKMWPWNPVSFKPTDPRRDLVKAGALIIAEIERIDRAAYVASLETVS